MYHQHDLVKPHMNAVAEELRRRGSGHTAERRRRATPIDPDGDEDLRLAAN